MQGSWKLISPNQICIKQISGGLSNLVFFVGLPDSVDPVGREPSQVLLRLFGDLGSGPAYQYRLITETVVFTMLAERNLGPTLQGVFPGGRLEEFIPGHPLTTTELRSPEYSDLIAKNVALVHSLEVPVSKEPTWLGDTMRSLVSKLKPLSPESVCSAERNAVLELINWDLRSEVDWLISFLKHVPSPVVFSHNDVNCGNILVREDKSAGWDPIVFIDYEFAAYNYRGFDLANHFIEWVYDYGTKVYPFYIRDIKQYPTRSQRERWIRKYLETYEEQEFLQEENNLRTRNGRHHNQPKGQMEDILDEVAAFSLASHLLWTVWALKQGQSSSITFSYYSYARDRLADYKIEKEHVVKLFQEKNLKGIKRRKEDDLSISS
ncbi:choline/ethanolamine kinase [Eurytemora carolleeae]|uniref:choline/ethanolamine kinase n=1 Tax=Eurytemora carolleeae TaxID=1294199 RepID=UPI000C761757|nr:choline/ethanolamine kinase [Eurytemora carolleeae]|eukprot:XP_023322093.1 choline/ethanolamine kinase-like [Eurytemora affinis]